MNFDHAYRCFARSQCPSFNKTPCKVSTSIIVNYYSRYEELLNEERITNQEVLALEKRFESWANAPAIVIPKKTRPASAPLNSHRDITKDLPPEVATFEVLVYIYLCFIHLLFFFF